MPRNPQFERRQRLVVVLVAVAGWLLLYLLGVVGLWAGTDETYGPAG